MSGSASFAEGAICGLGKLPLQRVNFSNALVAQHQRRVVRSETIPPVEIWVRVPEVDFGQRLPFPVRNPNTIKFGVFYIVGLKVEIRPVL